MHHSTHDLLSPVPGISRQLHSFHFGPRGGAKVYIQASLHADELPGMLVAWHLKRRLAELEQQGRLQREIILVPVANPVGLEQVMLDAPLGRFELQSGENFNRNFVDLSDSIGDQVEGHLTQDPAHNLALIREYLRRGLDAHPARTPLQSQRLTLQRLACDADLVLDLHCDFEAVEHLYTTPEAWPQVEPLARYLGAQASLLATDSGGQSFDECFSLVWWQLQQRFGKRFPIPLGSVAVTVELRGQADVSHELAGKDCQAILNYLTHAGVIEGIPLERAPGEWVHSVATPHELLGLLARIYSVPLEDGEGAAALPSPDALASMNDDMMILVVDDHPINRRLLADQLGSLGYQCKTANDGVDALNVLSKNHIDIVLSDVNMPNMDGYRLTQRIRQLGLTLPVVGVTANALAEEKQRCLESGMDSCLSKPVTLDVLKQTLSVYADRVRKTRI